MQRTVLLLIGLVTLALCGMLVLRERCSTFAIRKAQFERIEEGMRGEQVIAILGKPNGVGAEYYNGSCLSWRDDGITEGQAFALFGKPSSGGGSFLIWKMGEDKYRDGFVMIRFEWSSGNYRVSNKTIREPLSLWDRVMEALRFGEDQRRSQTFSF